MVLLTVLFALAVVATAATIAVVVRTFRERVRANAAAATEMKPVPPQPLDEERVDFSGARLWLVKSRSDAPELEPPPRTMLARKGTMRWNPLNPNLPTDVIVSSVGPDETQRYFAADEIRSIEAALRVCPAIGEPIDRPEDVLRDAHSYNVRTSRANLVLFGSPMSNPVTRAVTEHDEWLKKMGCQFLWDGVRPTENTTQIRFDGKFFSSPFPQQLEQVRMTGRSVPLEDFGMAALIRNPFEPDGVVLVFAGICALGTLGAARFVADFVDELVGAVNDDEYAMLIHTTRRDPWHPEIEVDVVHAHRVVSGDAKDIDLKSFSRRSPFAGVKMPAVS